MTATYEVVVPPVGATAYWPEIAFLSAGALAPIVALVGWGTPDIFERSGSLCVFGAATAEFIALNRLTRKHFLNACRARANEAPWAVSRAFAYVGYAAFALGLAGTLIWGFGSKWL